MVHKTQLTVLQWSASLYPEAPAFYIPDLTVPTGERRRWDIITYKRFLSNVEMMARLWAYKLNAQNIPPRSVVGIWLGGLTYTDVLHIYAVARAGYVPQLFSLRLPNPDVIYELLQAANAQALIYDASFAPRVAGCPVSALLATSLSDVGVCDVVLPAVHNRYNDDDTAMIFHTSGSTSGSPKLVRCTYKWLDAFISKASIIHRPFRSGRQDVILWMGSMCHIGQTATLLGAIQHGSAVVQPSALPFPSDELIDIIDKCSLNCLTQFSSFLSIHLRNSREDPKLLALLKGLDEVLHAGLPLPQEEETWARQNGILLRNLFGSTELGPMLISVGGRGSDASLLEPIKGTKYDFFPVDPLSTQTEAAYQNANSQLLELVVLSDSPDCPHPSLRHADGHFHTGDLFVEVSPGRRYISRGRDDDWIKSENALRCDTKSIEDNVRATCGDLVAECVVVGNGRPSPALFVEPRAADIDAEKLKQVIITRTRHFNSRRYVHERIASAKYVVVIPPGSLPRTATKGNVRRRAVEEAFRAQLDRVYRD